MNSWRRASAFEGGLKWRKQYFSWASHLARLPGTRLAKELTKCRDLRWWRNEQAQGSSRHPVRFKPWRWEDRIFQAASGLKVDWWEFAVARSEWPESVFRGL